MPSRRNRPKKNSPVPRPAPKPGPAPANPAPKPRLPAPGTPPPLAVPRTPPPERNMVREFDSMLRHSRPMLSVREVRDAFGVCLQQVHNWIDAGLVVGGDVGSGGERRRWMVTRASALAFYIKRFGW